MAENDNEPSLEQVEAQTVELMKDASRRAGMKLNAWISARLTEAVTQSRTRPTSPLHADIEGLVERFRALLAKTTPGFWGTDTEHNVGGEYGGGPDPGCGYDDFVIGASVRGEWKTLLTTENATEKEIEEEYGEDFAKAWDRIGEANVAFIIAAKNELPVLLNAIESLASSNEARRVALGRLNAHVETMQGMCSRYLEPAVYDALNGMFATERDVAGIRDKLFIADMIYMLDGPEQCEAQGAARKAYLSASTPEGDRE